MRLTASEQKLLERTPGLDIYRYPILSRDNVSLRDWTHHGVANRLLLDEPRSIVIGSMLMGRAIWNRDAKARSRKRDIDGQYQHLMAAIGNKDHQLLTEMKKSLPIDARWYGMDSQSMLYEIMVSLLHGDLGQVHKKSEDARNRSGEFSHWELPWIHALSAIALDQPGQLQEAINSTLEGVAKIQAIDPAFKIVYPRAHEIWQIAEYCRPGMLADWMPPAKRPWDQEYHELVVSINDASDVIDWSEVPEEFKPLFEVLPWL